MTTVTVTGATGYIGRHVLAQLATRPVHLVVLSRRAHTLDSWRDRVKIVESDMDGLSSVQLEQLATCDVLIHLAWEGLPRYRERHHLDVELPKQHRFLQRMIAHGVPAMVVAGTCLEYGLQSGELSEEHPTCPVTPYGSAKDSLRRQLEALTPPHNVALTWGRLFYSYGAGQPATSLYAQITAAVARGDRTFDMSGGEQLRDFLPAGEQARLLVEVALKRESYGVLNICAGTPVSVRRLAEDWIDANRWDLRLNLGRYPYLDYEPMAFWGARRKLDSILATHDND